MLFKAVSPHGTVQFSAQAGGTSIYSESVQECQRCHVMTHFFVNRRGETRCTGCDDET